MADAENRVQLRNILTGVQETQANTANALTSLISLHTDNAAVTANLTTTLTDIHAELQQHSLDEINRSLRLQARPTLDAYTANRPHKWANDQLAKIRLWSPYHADLLTVIGETIADANADPHPTLMWTDTASEEYEANKMMYLYLYATLPLSVQTRIRTDLDNRCAARNDKLLEFSAFYMWQQITRQDENLIGQHLARVKSLQCTDMLQLSKHLVQVRIACSDYFGSLPEADRTLEDRKEYGPWDMWRLRETCRPRVGVPWGTLRVGNWEESQDRV